MSRGVRQAFEGQRAHDRCRTRALPEAELSRKGRADLKAFRACSIARAANLVRAAAESGRRCMVAARVQQGG
jgi:hypothetical protein